MFDFLRQHLGFAGLILRAMWRMILGAGGAISVLRWRKAALFSTPAPVMARAHPRSVPSAAKTQTLPAQLTRTVGEMPRRDLVAMQGAEAGHAPVWLRH